MKAVLLAAGLGTRLRPITNSQPKCLVEINGKPLLAYWLDSLHRCGITQVLINLHYHADRVQNFLEQYSSNILIHKVFEPTLLGTAGMIRQNATFFSDESVLIAHADNLCLSDLSKFIEVHRTRPRHTVITMMTFHAEAPEECGIVELDYQSVVVGFHEKTSDPPGNNANGAVYIFEPEVVEDIVNRPESYTDISTDILPSYMGKIFAWPADGLHIDIGTPSHLTEANLLVSEQNSSNTG